MILLHYIVIGKFNSFRLSYEITTNENSSIGYCIIESKLKDLKVPHLKDLRFLKPRDFCQIETQIINKVIYVTWFTFEVLLSKTYETSRKGDWSC